MHTLKSLIWAVVLLLLIVYTSLGLAMSCGWAFHADSVPGNAGRYVIKQDGVDVSVGCRMHFSAS